MKELRNMGICRFIAGFPSAEIKLISFSLVEDNIQGDSRGEVNHWEVIILVSVRKEMRKEIYMTMCVILNCCQYRAV